MLTNILIILALFVVNGILAMSELAVVSARPARLRTKADEGSIGAAMALQLAEDSGRFLSTVQIGITLVGIVSGAFSGATLGLQLADILKDMGWNADTADTLGVGITVAAVTYLSLVIGELVPKQIALRHPEAIATKVAGPMRFLSKIAAPLVWILDMSGKAVLFLLGQSRELKQTVTDEEVKSVLNEAEEAGTIEAEEKEMISGVMRFADRQAKALMTPAIEVEMLDVGQNDQSIREQIEATRRSRLPVRDGSDDNILGVVRTQDLLIAYGRGEQVDLRKLMQKAPVIYENARSIQVLDKLRESAVNMGLVFDEYGHFEGVITTEDILAAIAGVFEEDDDGEPAFVQREDGSYLVSGWMPVDEFRDAFKVAIPPGDYETVGGLTLESVGHLPAVGEVFEVSDWTFEVVDLDGRRVDKLLITPPSQPDSAENDATDTSEQS
ncbi:hemolysin family protein [Notoacmeibacter sp. MSK16QG-6]|uniref:hemolysin family protein n=1 Tax=Notoacmeibacter sp. MSK16QG-6 TaxID=2957982 RepID=UPI00209ED87A|nr:hemolysin family protein [Notoacmeibacter sp. MSK16QG-6]MCP1198478.1 hemolysin family protein [Notoacmeibacter sp. MSK16QG-6]